MSFSLSCDFALSMTSSIQRKWFAVSIQCAYILLFMQHWLLDASYRGTYEVKSDGNQRKLENNRFYAPSFHPFV